MFQTETVRKATYWVVRLSALALIAIVYNNCGGSPFISREHAHRPLPELQDELVIAMKGILTTDSCRDSSQYHCTQKIFSPNLVNSHITVEFPCQSLSDGTQLCVQGESHQYNSSVAQKQCEEGCSDDYEFEEINCYYDISNPSGTYPMQSTKPSLLEALSDTYNLCLRLTNE